MRAPFPWFGGKSKVAAEVWARFGEPRNYVEPFFGSGAVLLHRSKPCNWETVNDKDGMVCNFWRAIQQCPDRVAWHARWPVVESDMHARQRWLIENRPSLTAQLEADPDWCDARIAGWWCWGQQIWIGGIFAQRADRCIPDLGSRRSASGIANVEQLAERLRSVRVTCGDWKRLMCRTVLELRGLTALFLDPPYGVKHRDDVYAEESYDVAAEVRTWCLEAGANPMHRIALCGYESEHGELEQLGWTKFEWKTSGGFGHRAKDQAGRCIENGRLERIWFSPHCLSTSQGLLFENFEEGVPVRLADLDKIFQTDCPECRDLFCHLGNRDLEVRALAEKLKEARQKLNMLEYVQAELTRFGIPEIGENGHKLSLVNRVKLLAERTSQRGRP